MRLPFYSILLYSYTQAKSTPSDRIHLTCSRRSGGYRSATVYGRGNRYINSYLHPQQLRAIPPFPNPPPGRVERHIGLCGCGRIASRGAAACREDRVCQGVQLADEGFDWLFGSTGSSSFVNVAEEAGCAGTGSLKWPFSMFPFGI